MLLSLAFLLSCALAPAVTQAQNTKVDIPESLPRRTLSKDLFGYSIEPTWLDDYVQTTLATKLLSNIAEVTGKPPPIRVGGNTADQTYLHPNQTMPSLAIPDQWGAKLFNISSTWFSTWSDYFPSGTDLIYTLNFAYSQSGWANALSEAAAAHAALGPKLHLLELGNEIDHFAGKKWRPRNYNVSQYVPEWQNLSSQIMQADWYRKAKVAPKFQAAVFADPPWIPDQHSGIDDMDIINVTKAGLVDPDAIDNYAIHIYPQSTCDTARWYRMSLDLLSDHSVVWRNVSQYVPQVAAAEAAGSRLVNGETNSVSCSGRSGISDTFGASLWMVDYVLLQASIGIEKVYFHLGAQSEYSLFTPLAYEYKNEHLEPGIRAPYYAHYFLSHVLAGHERQSITALPDANSSDFSGYGIYDYKGKLNKLVFLDMGVWNGTEGLSNPSTLSQTDSTFHNHGKRPMRCLDVSTPWKNATAAVTRLSGPGTNAKSLVNVSGVTFNPRSGAKEGQPEVEHLRADNMGKISLEIPQAGAVLLELKDHR